MTVGVYFNPDDSSKKFKKHVVETQRSATCIVFSIGRKFKHAVAFGATIRCVEIDLENTLRPVMYKGAAYPIAMAAQRYLNAGMVMTERAEKVLRNLIANEPIEEPTTPDEEKPDAVAATAS